MKAHPARRSDVPALARGRVCRPASWFTVVCLVAVLGALTTVWTSPSEAPRAHAAVVVSGPAGRDFATDRFADPWDYSTPDDMLLDGGPQLGTSSINETSGAVRAHFVGDGYLSPLWGGYGGPLLLGRDGAAPHNTLASGAYSVVSFHAYSSRDVAAGLFWFNCPGGAVAAGCGGGMSFPLHAGWHSYVLHPAASVFSGYPLHWGGTINGLRLSVSPGAAGSDFALDWMRVVEPGTGTTVPWANPRGGTGTVTWRTVSGQLGSGTLGTVTGSSGQVNVAELPPGSYQIGVADSQGAVASWASVTLTKPVGRILTPNAVGDRDYAGGVLGNPWDLDSGNDIVGVGNARDISFSGGQLAATNTSNDPYVLMRLGASGIDGRVYRNLTVTSAYDGPFDLRDVAGGGTMARVVWRRADGGSGQTDDILTYSGTRTVNVDLGMPTSSLVEPGTGSLAFAASSPVTSLRWDPNEDRGPRHWYLKDVQLRSDFATTGAFVISWYDASYAPGGQATLSVDTTRSGCGGRTIASVPVYPGTNSTVWNTAGLPAGRYWVCLRISRAGATSSTYAGGVVVVGSNPPAPRPDPVASWDSAGLALTSAGPRYTVSGWAFDPSAPQSPTNVDLVDTHPDGTSSGVRLTTGGSRVDVARVYPGTGVSSGWTGTTTPVPGHHTFCAYGINVGAGANTLIGCRTVDVPGPTGSLDAVSWSASTGLRAAGWAVDPGAPTQPTRVDIYTTGPSGRVGISTSTSGSRPDVVRVYPWAGPNTGFSASIRSAGSGVNEVCAYAIGFAPPGHNTLLGCQHVTVG